MKNLNYIFISLQRTLAGFLVPGKWNSRLTKLKCHRLTEDVMFLTQKLFKRAFCCLFSLYHRKPGLQRLPLFVGQIMAVWNRATFDIWLEISLYLCASYLASLKSLHTIQKASVASGRRDEVDIIEEDKSCRCSI